MFNGTVKEFKSAFFPKPERGIEQGSAGLLAKEGAYVRRRMQQTLRYAKKASAPGQPPKVHRSDSFTRARRDPRTGIETRRPTSPLKELIFFAFDRARNSVIVGPARFGTAGGRVPGVLEYGGSVTQQKRVARAKSGRKASDAQRKAFKKKLKDGAVVAPVPVFQTRTVRIAARPYVKPAGDAEAKSSGRGPSILRGLVRDLFRG